MQVLLGITLCALLLTLRSGVLVFAGEDDDVDAWGSIDSYFDYDAYDDAHRPAAVGAAIGQAASSAPHTEDTCSDPNPSSAADHPVGADGPTWGQSDPFDARTLDRFPGDDRVGLGNPHQASSSSSLSGNDNPLQCQYCGERFCDPYNRVAHESCSCLASERIPGTTLAFSTAGRIVLQCQYCTQEFRSRVGFRRHQAANPGSHTGSTSSARTSGVQAGCKQCQHCRKMFCTSSYRRKHEVSCAPLEGNFCSICHICRPPSMPGNDMPRHLRDVHHLNAEQVQEYYRSASQTWLSTQRTSTP